MTATAPRFGSAPLVRLLLVATVLLGTVFTVLSGTASAHAALTGSTPEDGAVVATAPKDISLTFSEQVAMGDNSIRVLDPGNKRADTGKIRDLSSGGTVTYGIDLRAGLPDGTYTVAWRAVSADSHPISGAFTFSIGAPSKTTAAVPAEEAGGGLVGVLYDIARYISYAGFILLVGGAAFVLGCWPRGASVRPLQRLVVQGWLTLTAATLVLLLLRSPYTGSGKLGDAFDLGGLQDVLATKTGAALVSRLLLLGAAALFVAVLFGAYAKRETPRDEEESEENSKERKDLTFGLAVGGTVVAAGIAGTWALAEHASTGIQTGLAMPVDVLHLLAVATWLGGLTALLVALYRAPSLENAAVRRFSRIAFISVVVLAATGLYQSWRQVGSWSALWGTSYGQLLLVKVGLVAVLVGLAWFSRRWTGRLGQRAEAGAENEAKAEAEAATGSETGSGTETAAATTVVGDSERATQLARQKAALATARQKRIRDADPGRIGLRRSVLAEAGVAVVLLAITTVLTSTEPGRTAEQEAGATGGAAATTPASEGPVAMTLPFDTGGENGKGTARLTLDPGRSGANAMHIYVDGPDGQPLDVPEVKAAFTLTAQQIGPLPITPEHVAPGHWSADAVQIPMPGDWQLQLTIRTSDIDQTTVDKNVKIG
ncbi:copper resistance protein CopC [Streptomyces scopuliridis]|uniref:Copper resistance protein CopC n=1 Tax=Streptomyces scopuliridis TaxID=452529 RepID=A0ACD4ZMT4_9ACTN|nr:copper resistance protein CopC [Streptomyces scopuliridis]WSB99111.1 copper resistance protein CopC [Streptomyces scopuliridis]WSC07186.1 copper resistance protein CopC [Streptomyces scopuliridis]